MLGKSEGIILRSQDYGEGNKILTVFTKELGKVGMMAQGARKTKSRFSAVSQPFIRALFLFHAGSSGLAKLSQGDLLESYPNIRRDLGKTAYVSYITELTDRLTEDRKRNTPLFQLLVESMNQIEIGKDSEIIARIFELKILAMYGYKPILDRCSACGKGSFPWFFSVKEGGLLCESCYRKDSYAFLISEGVARLLPIFQTMDMSQLGNINVKEATKEQLRKIAYEFIDEHIGVRLKSRHFIEQLAKMEQIMPIKENSLNGESADDKG